MSERNEGSQDAARSVGDVISALKSLSGDIESCAVVGPDGEVVYSDQADGVERQRSRAMLSALVGLAARAARSAGKEHVEQVRVKTGEGNLLLVRLPDGGTLAATTGPEARVGLALYDMRNVRPELSRALGAGNGTGGDAV
ncbi:putative distant relative of homeotic protein bithoraxoid [Rubrobacter radiotolerans]|uniref:Putative distant relative of homeotic protein bithoraxoid n=1 Tax=Rubrobacter radiotolerans TaxID=42256 RepID=A0A023X5L4_RUBRA|nr:roadblock/LC7 domain-containing protein [Rubrobacter radiotolerans]AHY47300.1 putative distant relative of homeotic protein bithoraxoid [Rubrobacter radiotolerans]MDX5894705.1 roadblock/LC7 domain-containing protein [Rubrobacter radiotolerans]SMC06578.1 hypothetical protein SAMN00767673_2020 [Rubrobacter radiotolerans DSM 5868]